MQMPFEFPAAPMWQEFHAIAFRRNNYIVTGRNSAELPLVIRNSESGIHNKNCRGATGEMNWGIEPIREMITLILRNIGNRLFAQNTNCPCVSDCVANNAITISR